MGVQQGRICSKQHNAPTPKTSLGWGTCWVPGKGGRKLANQLTYNKTIPDDPGEPTVITRARKWGGRGQSPGCERIERPRQR